MSPYSVEWHHVTTNRLKTWFIVAPRKPTSADLFRCERHESRRPVHVPWGPDRAAVIYSQAACSLFYHTKFTSNVPSAWHPRTLLGLFHSSLFLHAPPPPPPLLPEECLVQLQIMHSRHMLCAIPTILLVLRYVRCIIYWNAIRHFALQKCHVLVSAAGREHVRDSDGTGIRQRWRWWCWQAPKWRIGLFKRQAHLLRFYLSWQIYVQASILFFARCTMCHNN